MTKLNNRTKKEDIVKERENGTLCPANDLGLVSKDELIRYICYLTTELDAGDKAIHKLTSCFSENVTNLRLAHEKTVAELTTSIEELNKCQTTFVNEIAELQASTKLIKKGAANPGSVPAHMTSESEEKFLQADAEYINSVKPISHSIDEIITEDQEKELRTFLESLQFNQETGHKTATFGERYVYSKASGKNEIRKDIPQPLTAVITAIGEKFPDCKISSCLVNYFDAEGSLPEHSDDEHSIDPESDIFTVSIGGDGILTYRRIHDNKEITHTARTRSLYVMSRESQNFWTHRIEQGQITGGPRYSLTFRTVSRRYKNSLLVIGDSNTKRYKFGEGKGTLGYWTPGRTEYTPKVEHINPVSYNIKSYRNIMVQVGVNDLKTTRTPNDIVNVANNLMGKCHNIQNLNPDAKLYICPILPTRDSNMNKKIMYMNRFIQTHANNLFNVTLLNCEDFADDYGLLRRNLCVGREDPIHINNVGVSKIVTVIKGHIHFRAPYGTNKMSRVDGRPYAGVNSGRVNGMRTVSGVSLMNATTTGKEAFPALSRQSQT